MDVGADVRDVAIYESCPDVGAEVRDVKICDTCMD
jgi:hypothetical protein